MIFRKCIVSTAVIATTFLGAQQMAAQRNGRLQFFVDDSATSVTANVPFMGLSSKTATFPTVSGSITINPENIADIDMDIQLNARALTAGDEVTEKRLKGKDFFDATRYPTVRFIGTSLAMTTQTAGNLSGKLTARGVTRTIILAVNFAAPPAKAASYRSFTLTGNTTISRKQYGMTAYSGIVGDKVKIRLAGKMVAR
jgi:polyisoprenoid-binding protein YceI